MLRRRYLLTLILITVVTAGCISNGKKMPLSVVHQEVRPVRTGSVNIAIAEPVSLDPVDLEEQNGIMVGANLFDSLTDTDAKTMKVIPAAASSWESNKNLTIWTFHLRKGARFHNGREVQAGDFKYAWERIARKDSPTAVAYHLEPIIGFDEMQAGEVNELIGLKALDNDTLEVHLKYPLADFPLIVSNPTLAPVPKESTEGDPIAYADRPIGNGPFEMDEPWQHNKSITIKRFKEYSGQTPWLDAVVFRIFPDERSAYADFKNNKLDFSIVPVDESASALELLGPGKFEARDGQRFLNGNEFNTYFFEFNSNTGLYRQYPQVRKAISLAIDRQRMCSDLFAETRSPLRSIVPPGIPGWQPELRSYAEFDPERAKAMLAAAGFTNGKDEDGDPLSITITINKESSHEKIAQSMQEDLSRIGIRAVVSIREWESFLDDTAAGRVGFFKLGWMADYPCQDNFLSPLFNSKNIPTSGNGWMGDNRSRYHNPEVDALLESAQREMDFNKRRRAYAQAEQLILDDAVYLPLFVMRHRHAVSERCHGLTYDSLNRIDFSKVWVEPDDSRQSTE